MNEITYEIVFRLPANQSGESDILTDILVEAGFDLTDIIEQHDADQVSLSVMTGSEAIADETEALFRSLHIAGVSVERIRHYKDVWLNKWKDEIQPFTLTPGLDVCPVWKRDGYEPGGRAVIYIDTVSAFGTGLHETTRFMAQLIEQYLEPGSRFLDIGTGTGILCIVAAKCGAKTLHGVDISEDSVRVAQTNLKENGLTFDAVECVGVEDYVAPDSFDCVAANLVTPDLVSYRDAIIRTVRPGGWLAVSGVSLENIPKLQEAFSDAPLTLVDQRQGERWSAFLYRRKEAV